MVLLMVLVESLHCTPSMGAICIKPTEARSASKQQALAKHKVNCTVHSTDFALVTLAQMNYTVRSAVQLFWLFLLSRVWLPVSIHGLQMCSTDPGDSMVRGIVHPQ